MAAKSYKTEISNYLHPDGVLGHMLSKIRYGRKSVFLQKIRENIERAGFGVRAALIVLGKMRAQIAEWSMSFKNGGLSLPDAHRNVDMLTSPGAWVYKESEAPEAPPAQNSAPKKKSPPPARISQTFGVAAERPAFATPQEWTRSIYSHLPEDRKGENYSSVECGGGAPELKYDPNGRGEYSQFVRPNVAINGVNFVYDEGPDRALVCATLRSQIDGAVRMGAPFVVKFDNAAPEFVSIFLHAAAMVYLENPAAYSRMVAAFVINGQKRGAVPPLAYLAGLKRYENTRNLAMAAQMSGMARAA
ncbi:MAG: hypothetical protein LBL21_03850 [Rickettsiales bacterium]|nr:hypothetical protein [Rickettsiales bacterium]